MNELRPNDLSLVSLILTNPNPNQGLIPTTVRLSEGRRVTDNFELRATFSAAVPDGTRVEVTCQADGIGMTQTFTLEFNNSQAGEVLFEHFPIRENEVVIFEFFHFPNGIRTRCGSESFGLHLPAQNAPNR